MSTEPFKSAAASGSGTFDGRHAAKVTIRTIQGKFSKKQPITVLTAYDHGMALAADAAGVDVILVGDSVGMVVHGSDSTISVTLDDMIRHSSWVVRGAPRPLIVADLPFGSYTGPGAGAAVSSAVRLLQEGRAHAVKLEGGRTQASKISAIVEEGIPVMGHVGLLPQTAPAVSGYALTGRTAEGAVEVLLDALAVQEAGAFSVVLEKVPSEVALVASELLRIPTIGIGAGPACGGQVLVAHDLLGLYPRTPPKFVRQFVNLRQHMQGAFETYCNDVAAGRFPDALPGWTPAEGSAAASHSHTLSEAGANGAKVIWPGPQYHFLMPLAECQKLLDAMRQDSPGTSMSQLRARVPAKRWACASAALESVLTARLQAGQAPSSNISRDDKREVFSPAAVENAKPSAAQHHAGPATAIHSVSSLASPASRIIEDALRSAPAFDGAPLRIAIVGSGSVASLYAALMANSIQLGKLRGSVTIFTLTEDRASQLRGEAPGAGGIAVQLHPSLGGAVLPITGQGAHGHVSVAALQSLPGFFNSLASMPGDGHRTARPADEPHAGQYDLVLLANKAYQAETAAAAAGMLASPSGFVAPLYNGGYTLEFLAARLTAGEGAPLRPQQLMYATTSHGARQGPCPTVPGRTLVMHTGMGNTLVAPVGSTTGDGAPDGAALLASVLRSCGVTADSLPASSVPALRWAKIAVNCVLNPVAALLGLTNGEVAAWYRRTLPRDTELMRGLAREAAEIMMADLASSEQRSHTGGPVDPAAQLRAIPGWADFAPSPGAHSGPSSAGEYVLAKALAVAEATGPNVCSYLSDLRGCAPSEVQFVNGWVAERGQAQADRAGPPLSLHEDVMDALLAKEGLLVTARRGGDAGDEVARAIDEIRAASAADV